MSYLVNLVLTGRPATVVGGGKIAARKVHDLLAAGAEVTVVSPAVCDPVEAMAAAGRIRLRRRPYADGDLRGASVVVAATDNEELNARVSRDAQSLAIPVNVVDRPALCTFTLPAVVRRGDLTLAVSTEGQCPALSSVMREQFEKEFGEEYAEVVSLLSGLRRDLIRQGCSGDRIREAVRNLYLAGIAEMIRTNDRQALEAARRAALSAARA